MIAFRREMCTYCGGCVSLCAFSALELVETGRELRTLRGCAEEDGRGCPLSCAAAV
jgi:ferredoxin